jgi:Peptidase family S41
MAKRNATGARKKTPAIGATASVSGAVPYRPQLSESTKRSMVESLVGTRVALAEYRTEVVALNPAQRELLIDQAILVLDQLYAHLPLKRSLHGSDPIQLLRLLRLRQARLEERAFQSALIEIFNGLRDLHTNYVLPKGYAQKFAFLPFRIEEFYEPGGLAVPQVPPSPKYVVSWVSFMSKITTLKEGMIVTHWNGSPIEFAVARNGNREAGSNADARAAQGIESLTLRWLGMSLPPDEDWVTLTYTDGTKTHHSRFDWEVIDPPDPKALLAVLNEAADAPQTIGLDIRRLLLDRAHKLIFDPETIAVEAEREVVANVEKIDAVAASPPWGEGTSLFPDVFPRVEEVTTPSGKFGYIRLKTFLPSADKMTDVISSVVDEFCRILSTLPQNGLILDVRGNGGGYVNIGERILQTLTPRTITPQPFHFLATPLTLKLVSDPNNGFEKWKDTVVQGLESGASFSQGFPLTRPEDCNKIGQLYQGPVVLITDALCYSTTDIFAAGFQDHQIGRILGCHSSTGAGGATVWEHESLQKMISQQPQNPFVALPEGAMISVAALRCTRVGSRSGIPVEDYGVVAEDRYYMTKADVLGRNENLIAAAANILKSKSPAPRSLRLKADPAGPLQKFTIQCSNIDRVDLFVDGRAAFSRVVSVDQFEGSIQLPFAAADGSVVGAKGYRDGELVVSFRLTARS